METAKEGSRETGTYGKSQPQKVLKTTVNSIFIIVDWGFSLTERDLYMKERHLCECLPKHRLRVLIGIFVWADAATLSMFTRSLDSITYPSAAPSRPCFMAEVNKATR